MLRVAAVPAGGGAEPSPAWRLRALRWLHAEERYVCGALHDPATVFGWGHRPWGRMLSRALRPAIAPSIAAGRGCDCDVEVDRPDA
ncbi:hypothetical protein [Tepidimonas aquatica]|uniref:hypothetical protein n=1 Tax=Tepidimonas aquatica TaxID=247482 RepID=UPI003CCC5334